jgi:hypothetical protein
MGKIETEHATTTDPAMGWAARADDGDGYKHPLLHPAMRTQMERSARATLLTAKAKADPRNNRAWNASTRASTDGPGSCRAEFSKDACYI